MVLGKIQLEEVITEQEVNTVVEKQINLPGNMPGAARIVNVTARNELLESSIKDNRVLIKGTIRTHIYYIAINNPAEIQSLRQQINYQENIMIEGIRSNNKLNLQSIITAINFEILNEKLFKIEYKLLNQLEITALEIVRLFNDDRKAEVKKEKLIIRQQLLEKTLQSKISSNRRLPGESSDIRKIIEIEPGIRVLKVETLNQGIVITGIIDNNILYLNTGRQLESVLLHFPFRQYFAIKEVKPSMSVFVDCHIIEEQAEKVDNRKIKKSLNIKWDVMLVENSEKEVIVKDSLPLSRKKIVVEKIILEKKQRIMVRDQIIIPEEKPAAAKIAQSFARLREDLFVTEINWGGVLLKGRVDTNILYVADRPAQPVFHVSRNIPFSFFIEITEIEPGMKVIAEAAVRTIRASLVGNRKINVRLVVQVELLITKTVKIPLFYQQ